MKFERRIKRLEKNVPASQGEFREAAIEIFKQLGWSIPDDKFKYAKTFGECMIDLSPGLRVWQR